ncbi:MAG: hypothetical protein AB1414_00320 [bacterium]
MERDKKNKLKEVKLSFLILSILVLTGCGTVELHHGLSEDEANKILVVLHNHNIYAKKIKEESKREIKWKVVVKESQAKAACRLLQDYKLPGEKEKGVTEIFSNTNLIPTPTEEKALFLQSLCGEISKTLKTISGVVNARVHISMPETNLFYEDESQRPKPTASVLIEYEGERIVRRESIQNLVANAVEGLSPKNVAVIVLFRQPKLSSEAKNSLIPFSYLPIIIGVLLILIVVISIFLVISVIKIQSLKRKISQYQT